MSCRWFYLEVGRRGARPAPWIPACAGKTEVVGCKAFAVEDVEPLPQTEEGTFNANTLLPKPATTKRPSGIVNNHGINGGSRGACFIRHILRRCRGENH